MFSSDDQVLTFAALSENNHCGSDEALRRGPNGVHPLGTHLASDGDNRHGDKVGEHWSCVRPPRACRQWRFANSDVAFSDDIAKTRAVALELASDPSWSIPAEHSD